MATLRGQTLNGWRIGTLEWAPKGAGNWPGWHEAVCPGSLVRWRAVFTTCSPAEMAASTHLPG